MKTLARSRCVDEILQRVGRLEPESPRRWGRMSAHQMVCHLTDAFRMATGEIRTARTPALRERTLIKCLALYAPLRWPPGIRTVPEVDQDRGGTPPVDFEADRRELERRVRSVAARRGARASWPPHPIFGPLSEAQWLRWSYLHTDHHLRQFGV